MDHVNTNSALGKQASGNLSTASQTLLMTHGWILTPDSVSIAEYPDHGAKIYYHAIGPHDASETEQMHLGLSVNFPNSAFGPGMSQYLLGMTQNIELEIGIKLLVHWFELYLVLIQRWPSSALHLRFRERESSMLVVEGIQITYHDYNFVYTWPHSEASFACNGARLKIEGLQNYDTWAIWLQNEPSQESFIHFLQRFQQFIDYSQTLDAHDFEYHTPTK